MSKNPRAKKAVTAANPVAAAVATAMARQEAQRLEREKLEAETEDARVYQMALFPADKRAMPLEFVPCALFAAVQTKQAPYLRGEKIVSVNGYTIIFTGRRLTQVHADVLMGVAALASEQPQGHIARIELRKFHRLIGREFGTHSRQSLRQLLDDLIACAVRITDASGKDSFAGHILTKAADRGEDDDKSVFLVEITRDFCKLFQRDFALVDWEQRLKLKNKPLALWLQLYFSQFQMPVAVKELHRLSGSVDALRFFRRRLKRELTHLEEAGALAQSYVDDEDVVHVAPVGKPLPARFTSRHGALSNEAATQPQLSILEHEESLVSAAALVEFRALYPGRDPERCLADFLRWPGSRQARVPDRAYLGFAKKWVKEQVLVPATSAR